MRQRPPVVSTYIARHRTSFAWEASGNGRWLWALGLLQEAMCALSAQDHSWSLHAIGDGRGCSELATASAAREDPLHAEVALLPSDADMSLGHRRTTPELAMPHADMRGSFGQQSE